MTAGAARGSRRRRNGSALRATAAVVAAVACFGGAPPKHATAQGMVELAQACAAETPAGEEACRELALAAAALQRGVGLASALGSDVPGSSSTMGRRIGRMPRMGLSVAALGVRVAAPRLTGGSRESLQEEATGWITGMRLSAAVGVLEGFQLGTAVGGVLSLDVLGGYSLLRLPASAGLDGWSSGGGAGLRVGLTRESFTLPGVSVSAMRRWRGDFGPGAAAAGPASVETGGSTVTSVRATAGKNWFVVGLLGGVGWDRYSGRARLSVPGDAEMRSAAEGRLRSSRRLYFAGAWLSYLVTRLAVEAGVAEGLADPFTGRGGAFDPGARTWFASAALRVTL